MNSDIGTMLWKEWREAKINLKNEIATFAVFSVLSGIVVTQGIIKDIGVSGILPFVWLLGGILFLTSVMYSELISEGSFVAEKSKNTLCMLLTTRMPPTAVFTGKWIAMMFRAFALIAFIYGLQLITVYIYCQKNDIGITTLNYNGIKVFLAIIFAILGSSYTITINAVLSLIIRDSKQLRQFSMLIVFAPLIALWGFIKLFGVGWSSVLFIGLYLFLLTLVSFAVALIIFRSEKVRL